MATETLGNWTENQEKFIRFLGRGKRDANGVKYTTEKFAELIGVHYTTLYDWRNLPGFMQAVFDRTVKENIDVLPDMIKAQVALSTGQELMVTDKNGKQKKANPGNTQAFMALMRQFGLLQADKSETKTEHSGEVAFTNSVPIQ